MERPLPLTWMEASLVIAGNVQNRYIVDNICFIFHSVIHDPPGQDQRRQKQCEANGLVDAFEVHSEFQGT